MKSKDITVIIPTYNSQELIRRTVASLEQQIPDPTSFRVIVVDDGSTDGTGVWLKSYSGCLRMDPVVLPENHGRPAVRNIGADRADSELLLFIDGDMEFGTGFVAGHAKFHSSDHTVVIGSAVYDRSLGNRGYARYIEGRGVHKLRSGQSDDPVQPVPGRYFLSGNASLSKRLFDKIGGFDERFRTYGEDIDFGIRLASAGGQFIFVPELVLTQLHIRSLREVLTTAFAYGRASIPMLVDKHPELYRELRLDFPDKKGISGFIRRMIMSEPIFKSMTLVASVLNRYWAPAMLYSYLLFRSYYKGYQEAQK